MKKATSASLLAISASLLLVQPATTKQRGLLPFDNIRGVNVGSLTRTSSQSCGACHTGSSGVALPGLVDVEIKPGARVLPAGSSTPMQVSSTSSTASPSGGFVSDVTAGSFVAGSSTRTRSTGDAITHSTSANRSWSFTYKASTTPGLAEMYTVAMNSNGNQRRDNGDRYAFHGSDPANTTSTPVRLYANAPGFKAVGESCSDGFGNFSVLGGKTPPAIGATFTLETFGLPPAAPLLFMLSVGTNLPPLDLVVMGAPGCVLRQNMTLQVPLKTSPGNVNRAEGGFSLPIPVPNNPGLRGLGLTVQFGAIDSNSSQAFPFVVTNGLEITIQ